MLKQKAASVKYPRSSRPNKEMISLSVPRSSRSLSPARSAPNSPMTRNCPNGALTVGTGVGGVIMSTSTTTSGGASRDRAGSISLSPRSTIPVCQQLTPSQVSTVRRSWRHINTKGLIVVLTRCFSRLESTCPIVSQCFQSATYSLSTNPNQVRTVADHAKYLLQLLDKIIEGDVDTELLREIGANHVNLKLETGFSSQEWDRFQEIMVEVILKQDGVKQSKETSRAWRLLICSIVELMRDGFDAQLRQCRRKHSFNAHVQYFENIERRVSVCPNRKISLNVESRQSPASIRKFSQF
ncbi:unnamed protein product [Caenorhabditis angaria]|uniref:Globin domain-containing protein n=1 Tax=Caenorhabditis angaria TaxID=860376 RepID=A0A9P1MXR9_9PELO|nr:unnamed protein product [Caenorhabditis angaria]